MTKPENIEQAFSGTAYPVDAATGKNPTIEAVKVAMRRLLCPLPEKGAWYAPRDECPSASIPIPPYPAPPPSPSPDATEKGGDRAREAADKAIRLMAERDHISFSEWERARIERGIADALRAYGDELLEKAAALIQQGYKDVMPDLLSSGSALCIIESLKSSATKGAANG